MKIFRFWIVDCRLPIEPRLRRYLPLVNYLRYASVGSATLLIRRGQCRLNSTNRQSKIGNRKCVIEERLRLYDQGTQDG